MEEVTYEGTEEQGFDSITIDYEATESYRNSNSLTLIISIESFQIIEDRVQKHVVYKITGEEHSTKFEMSRRYKEFRILH